MDEQALAAEQVAEQTRTERIYGREIPVGTLDEFAKALKVKLERNDDGSLKPGAPAPYLGLEKFWIAGQKCYRLIWIYGASAWLAGEDQKAYRAKYVAVAAGAQLAAEKGAKFSEMTR
jgi:hypothetical protein